MSSVGQVLFAFFEDYLKVQRGLRPGSIRSYRDTLKLFLTHIATACRRPITRLNLSDLTSDRVLEFLRTIEAMRNNKVSNAQSAPGSPAYLLPVYRRSSSRPAGRSRAGRGHPHQAHFASGNHLLGAG